MCHLEILNDRVVLYSVLKDCLAGIVYKCTIYEYIKSMLVKACLFVLVKNQFQALDFGRFLR